jgi:curli biogenesis system outer membrane secretion channel CsgG
MMSMQIQFRVLSAAVISAALSGCWADTATSAATAAAVKKQELEQGQKILEQVQQKIDQSMQKMQQAHEKSGAE